MKNERKNITQPADWWGAFEAEAKKRRLTLSEFMGIAAAKMLTKEQRAQLNPRAKPGRKKSEDIESIGNEHDRKTANHEATEGTPGAVRDRAGWNGSKSSGDDVRRADRTT